MFLFSTSTTLIVVGNAARYNINVADGDGLDNVVSLVKYCLSSSKACCCSCPHSKRSKLRSILKKGRPLSADLEMNLFNAASLPINFCTCFLLAGGFMFTIVAMFLGFASMPLVDIMQPSSLPFLMSNMHLSRFSLRPAFLSFRIFPAGPEYGSPSYRS